MVTFGTTAAVHYKIAQQATLLSQTFQLRPANAASIIHCKEDHDFLQSMTGDRKASFGVFDQALLDRVQNNDTQEKAQPDAYSSAVAGDDGAGDDW